MVFACTCRFPRCNNLDIGSFLPAKCGVTNGQMGTLTQVSSWKSWLKPPRTLLIILMYSLTDVWLFYHYNNQWAPVYRLYITIPMRSNVIPSTQWDPQRLLQSSHLQLMSLPDGQGHHPGMQRGRLLRRRILYIWFQSRLLRIWNFEKTRMPLRIYSLHHFTKRPMYLCIHTCTIHGHTWRICDLYRFAGSKTRVFFFTVGTLTSHQSCETDTVAEPALMT